MRMLTVALILYAVLAFFLAAVVVRYASGAEGTRPWPRPDYAPNEHSAPPPVLLQPEGCEFVRVGDPEGGWREANKCCEPPNERGGQFCVYYLFPGRAEGLK